MRITKEKKIVKMVMLRMIRMQRDMSYFMDRRKDS